VFFLSAVLTKGLVPGWTGIVREKLVVRRVVNRANRPEADETSLQFVAWTTAVITPRSDR
jgi:hypothetical protein